MCKQSKLYRKRRYRPQTTSATACTILATHNVDIGHKLTKISKKEWKWNAGMQVYRLQIYLLELHLLTSRLKITIKTRSCKPPITGQSNMSPRWESLSSRVTCCFEAVNWPLLFMFPLMNTSRYLKLLLKWVEINENARVDVAKFRTLTRTRTSVDEQTKDDHQKPS